MKKNKTYTYDYPMPAVTADVVLIGYHKKELSVLLIKRKNAPYKGQWAFPGGYVEENETVEKAAVRELLEETGIKIKKVEQFYTFSKPKRDPRGRTITVAHIAVVDADQIKPKASDDAAEVAWVPLKKIKKLAFDHTVILQAGLEYLQKELK
jgi:8-oxo-dGTP diphosphatase